MLAHSQESRRWDSASLRPPVCCYRAQFLCRAEYGGHAQYCPPNLEISTRDPSNFHFPPRPNKPFPAYTRFPRGTIQFPTRDKAKEDSVTSKNFPSRPCPTYYTYTLTHTGARTTTGALLHTDSMHRVSFYFLKIPMDRMPPASARYTYARARTCDHTNPHPRAWLVKNVWVARTQGGKERERSRVEEEES